MKPKVAVLPGDGVGPEVTAAALSVLQAVFPVEAREGLVGGIAIDKAGNLLFVDAQNLRVRKVIGIAAPGIIAGR